MNAPTDLIEKWRAERERKAYLALEDGTVFHGVSFGYKMDRVGEVVFNLYDAKRIGKTESDSRADFIGGFNFKEEFLEPYGA